MEICSEEQLFHIAACANQLSHIPFLIKQATGVN